MKNLEQNQYNPSETEVKKAEESMLFEQKELSEEREHMVELLKEMGKEGFITKRTRNEVLDEVIGQEKVMEGKINGLEFRLVIENIFDKKSKEILFSKPSLFIRKFIREDVVDEGLENMEKEQDYDVNEHPEIARINEVDIANEDPELVRKLEETYWGLAYDLDFENVKIDKIKKKRELGITIDEIRDKLLPESTE
jgi:hypothetical protein